MTRRKIVFSTIIAFLFFSACALQQSNTSEKAAVNGTVLRVKAHCGGARLSEERYKEIQKPHEYPNKKLFVKKGKWNDLEASVVLEFISDSTGHFSFSLPPGEYCIVDEYKNDKTNYDKLLNQFKKPTQHYSAISPSCLKEWFKTPDGVLTVPANGVNNFIVTFNDKCSWNSVPCVTYHGPLPP